MRKENSPDFENCWALLERVAASSQLRRAARLQELLFYMGKRSLKDGIDRVREQEIGAQVFGRPESYDTTFDNIVRTNVSDLRKRIDAYFNSEGQHEKLIVEIPRGNYILVFRYRSAELETPANAQVAIPEVSFVPLHESGSSETTQADDVKRRPLNARTVIASALVALSIAVALFYWSQYHNLYISLYGWKDRPAVAALWSQILASNAHTDIVISDTSIGLAQTLSHQTFTLKDYLSRGYISQLQSAKLSPDTNAALSRILAWNLGSPDEFMLARRILMLDPLGKNIHLYSARYYMADLMKRDNVILIGAQKSNPWDELFDGRTNFVTTFNDNGLITVINRSPTSKEQPIYAQTDAAEYCVVSYLPNPEHTGVALLIEGTDAEATEAAGDFLLSEEQLSNFRKMLHANNFPYFEVLLKVSSVRGTPLTATIAAYRVYPDLY